MKIKIIYLYIIIGLAFLFSCNYSQNKSIEKKISSKPISMKKDSMIKKNKHKISQMDYDSIWLVKIYDSTLTYVKNNINKRNFTENFVNVSQNGLEVNTKIKIGNLFIPNMKNIYIRRNIGTQNLINVYTIKGKELIEVFYYTNSNISDEYDSIVDVNGDRRKDIIINFYGSTGCCLKNIYKVFLNKNDNTFSEGIFFMNPTFSKHEQIVRGVEYGQPGDTELYKYKWNNYELDTLEYIYFELDSIGKKTGKFIKSDKKPYSKDSKKKIRLNFVPKEYHNIYGYDWFLGNDE